MAIILDIAGKPLHPRNNSKKRLRGQDLRDLLKILIILSLIILGYFVFVPGHDSTQSPQARKPCLNKIRAQVKSLDKPVRASYRRMRC